VSCSKNGSLKKEKGTSELIRSPRLSSRIILTLARGTALCCKRGRLGRSESSIDGSWSALWLLSKILWDLHLVNHAHAQDMFFSYLRRWSAAELVAAAAKNSGWPFTSHKRQAQ